ncbi:MAG: hypothetical protein QOI51_2493 [Nocardioidaceae bacterium]|jgi:hypothetical protein|nr:hypothetical protein [Nocardioidaceae bacterium]MDX6308016.1 hypothetical protein [Nocardioidaceae bacterium]
MSTALKAQPAAISAALVAVLNALVLLGEVRLDAEQISAVNIAVVAVLGVFVHQTVTPSSNVVAVKKDGGAVAGPALIGISNGEAVSVGRATASSDAR